MISDPILQNSWTSSLSGKVSLTSTNRKPWKRFQRNLLCAIVVEKAPEAIRMHLLVQCGEKPDFLKLRQTVHDYCYSMILGPIAMDVGAITKGRGKGKRKGKYESHGDGGKGKKGKKGQTGEECREIQRPRSVRRLLWGRVDSGTQAETLLAQPEGNPSQSCFSR